jgi:hypothetical protein
LLGVKYIIISHQDPAKQSNCSGRSDLNSSLSVQTSLCVTLSYGKQLPELRDLDLNHFSGSPAKSELLVAKTQRVPALYNGVRHAAPVEPTDHERPVRMPRPVSFAPLTRSEEVFPCAGRRTKSLEPSPSSASWLCWFTNTTVYHSKLKFKMYKQMQRLGFCSMLGNQSAHPVQSLPACSCCSYKYSAHPHKMVRVKTMTGKNLDCAIWIFSLSVLLH